MVYCSGLENPPGKPAETMEMADFCGSQDAQDALFTERSAPRDGTKAGTLLSSPLTHRKRELRDRGKPIVKAAAEACGLSYHQIMGRRRTTEYVEARFIAMLILHRQGWSYPKIAVATGRDDHTTCLHGVRQARRLIESDPGFSVAVGFVERQFKLET